MMVDQNGEFVAAGQSAFQFNVPRATVRETGQRVGVRKIVTLVQQPVT